MTDPTQLPPDVLAEMRELALAELNSLLERLDAGNLVLLDYSAVNATDNDGRPAGVRTYTFTVRTQPRRTLGGELQPDQLVRPSDA